ncbi:tRNA pseudouridine(65) synthase TruC [soil metagenome]
MSAPVVVLHRDADVVVVDKPAGVLTHRSELAGDDDVMMTRVRDAIGAWVWPVHRLDRQTSGVLVFALSEASANELATAFAAGTIDKTYLAIVRGSFPEAADVDHPIPKREDGPKVAAQTSFRRIEIGALHGHEGATWSLVEARPKTGRFHQVRRHVAHLRHPIACDSNYGTGWFNRAVRALGMSRLALHAAALTLPTSAGVLTVRAPLQADLTTTLDRLRST